MRLLLIRHGETVHNVAGVYAGVTDSALTNHGVLQANRLGAHLAATGVKVSHIFSSDLQRAANTAEAIRVAQSPMPPEVTKLSLLREQDFGFYECKVFADRTREADIEARRIDPDFKEVESAESMIQRVDTFLDVHLLPLLNSVQQNDTVVVVAHGIILNYLWRAFLKRFPPGNVAIAASADRGMSLEYLGSWSNTGVLDLEIQPKSSAGILPQAASSLPTVAPGPSALTPAESGPSEIPQQPATTAFSPAPLASRPMLPHLTLVVKAVNSREHVNGLKKTRGGIGSLKHDPKQKTMDSFFKKA